MLIANWINLLNSKKPYFNREKLKKEVSIKEKKGWYRWYCYKSKASSFIC